MFHNIIKFLKSITKTYPTSTFKIVGVSGDPKNKNTQITYQVSGKATITTEKPNQLIKELMQIKGFSQQDAELIYNLVIAEKMSCSFRILSILLENEPIKFEIEDVHSNYTLLLTAEEIISTNTMLENFSSTDISMIYFQLMKENEQKHLIKKNRSLPKSKHEAQGIVYLLQRQGVNE